MHPTPLVIPSGKECSKCKAPSEGDPTADSPVDIDPIEDWRTGIGIEFAPAGKDPRKAEFPCSVVSRCGPDAVGVGIPAEGVFEDFEALLVV